MLISKSLFKKTNHCIQYRYIAPKKTRECEREQHVYDFVNQTKDVYYTEDLYFGNEEYFTEESYDKNRNKTFIDKICFGGKDITKITLEFTDHFHVQYFLKTDLAIMSLPKLYNPHFTKFKIKVVSSRIDFAFCRKFVDNQLPCRKIDWMNTGCINPFFPTIWYGEHYKHLIYMNDMVGGVNCIDYLFYQESFEYDVIDSMDMFEINKNI